MRQFSHNSPADSYNVHYDNYMNTAADTECTGLIYRAAENLEEWENYKDILNFIPASPGSYSFAISEEKD